MLQNKNLIELPEAQMLQNENLIELPEAQMLQNENLIELPEAQMLQNENLIELSEAQMLQNENLPQDNEPHENPGADETRPIANITLPDSKTAANTDKKYQDERYMLRHLRTSHTRSTYTCPLCHKCVTSATGLRHHVITHSDLNTFRCKCCPKAYAVKKTIIKHLKKRHNLDGSEINIKDYFTRLDPRDCKLGLDEETMNMIFGPRKFVSDVMIGDYVTLAKNIKLKKKIEERETSDEQAKESDSTNDEIATVNIKQEVHSEEDLEPTDFVSVKIESVEHEEGCEMDE